MTVVKIVERWLKDNGFDGLYSPDTCSCKIGDLMPCGECAAECKPGVFVESDDDEYEFCIGALESQLTAAQKEIEQVLGKALGYPAYRDDPNPLEAVGVPIPSAGETGLEGALERMIRAQQGFGELQAGELKAMFQGQPEEKLLAMSKAFAPWLLKCAAECLPAYFRVLHEAEGRDALLDFVARLGDIAVATFAGQTGVSRLEAYQAIHGKMVDG